MLRFSQIAVLTAAFAAGAGALADSPTALYVDASHIVGTRDGRDWTTAYTTLQDAILEVGTHPTVQFIYVAKGTYTPGNWWWSTFLMPPGVSVLGGYPTGGGARNTAANPTILSGIVNAASGWKAYHVVTCDGGMYLDGFTIQDGSASSSPADTQGGGVLIKSGWGRLANCTVQNNVASGYGGGVAVWPDAKVWIYNTTIASNMATAGGGLFVNSADTGNAMHRVTLKSNAATNGGGAFITGTLYAESCLLHANTASSAGAVYMSGNTAAAELVNCTIVSNTATSSRGAIYVPSGYLELYNSILSGNSAPSYNHASGYIHAYRNNIYGAGFSAIYQADTITTDPKFTSLIDFHLKSTSPCLNVGYDPLIRYSTDLDGSTRIMRSVIPTGVLQVDLGCYERSPLLYPVP